jgi:hypothetical protein
MLEKLLVILLVTGSWLCLGEDSIREAACDRYLNTEKQYVGLKSDFYLNFTDNPCLSERMKSRMAPWLLPQVHPMKAALDEIFSQPGVNNSEKTLRKAGFKVLFSQKRSLIRVISHPNLPGYLIKLFPNSEKALLSSGWKRLTIRCIVAKKIKSIIARHHLRHFIVADKWLYPVPCTHQKAGCQPVVLLVKNMNIYSRKETKHVWKKHASRRVVKELYQILGRGYGSPFLSGNLPYTKMGTFAFIDTEYNKRKINLGHARSFLSRPMQRYWNSLVKHHDV